MKRRVAIFLLVILVAFNLLLSTTGATGNNPANLALGKNYEIFTEAANTYSYGHTEVGPKNQLTDGKIGDPSDYYGGAWSHFVRGIGRDIIIDLESEMTVTGFQTAFVQLNADGIYCPKEVTFSLSEDGENFMTVFKVKNPIPNTAEGTHRAVYKAFGEGYRARYVKLHFDVDVNVFCDEIYVYGQEDPTIGLEIIPKAPIQKELYIDTGEKVGAKDIICFHYGYWPDDFTKSDNKKEVFKPYLGYIDKDGEYQDTMFDAVMFLIIQGRCPSGGNLNANGPPSILSDWEYLIENTFKEGINLSALDEATRELKDQLQLPEDHKTTVYLSAPHAKISDVVFGDYDGDGVENVISSLDDCVDLYAWYIDKVLEIYNQQNYRHLDLKGFFWSNESLSSLYYEDEPLYAERCVKELHKRDMQCIFIPFYQATGIDRVEELGFDATIMQPNLPFADALQKYPRQMMDDFIYNASFFHTGMQVEAHDNFRNNIAKYGPLFMEYLYAGERSGLMTDGIHAYYQGAGYGVFHQWAVVNEGELRWFYDALYRFIKGTLRFPDFNVIVDKELTVGSGEAVYGNFRIDGDWNPYQHNLSVAKLPRSGTMVYRPEAGQYMYRASRKYVGQDSFTLKYLDQDGKEQLIVVDVTVIETNKTEDMDSISDKLEKDNQNPVLNPIWYIIISAISIIIIILVLLLFKTKRKRIS